MSAMYNMENYIYIRYKIWQARKHERQPHANLQKSGDTVFRND